MNYITTTNTVSYDSPVYDISDLKDYDSKKLNGMSPILRDTIVGMLVRGLVRTEYDVDKQLVTYTFETVESGIPSSPDLANPKSISIKF